MSPAIAGKTGQVFPTQDITDLTVNEEIDCLPENYTPIDPETPHPDNDRTGLNLILVWQGPSPIQSDPQKVRRVYMTLPGAWTTDTRLDPDGATVTIRTRKALNRLIVTSETVSGGIWTKTTNGPGGDAIVGDEVQESRPVPGNPMPEQKIDPDGGVVSIIKTLKESASITPIETLIGGVWSETLKEPVSQLVAHEIVKSRTVPGGTMTISKIEPDGQTATIRRTLKDQTTITTGETLGSGIWTRITKEDPPVFRGFELRSGNLIAWEIVETRAIPGTPIVKTDITKDGDALTETRTLTQASTIATTTSIVGGVWTRTFEELFANSSLVAWKVVQVRTTAHQQPFYSIEIPDLWPADFRAAFPTTTTDTTEIGTAAMPSLAAGDIFRSQQQLDEYTYRLKIVSCATTLPVSLIDKALDGIRAGGSFFDGYVAIVRTLSASNLPIEEDYAIVHSRVRALGGGLYLRETGVIDAFPVLVDEIVDPVTKAKTVRTKTIVPAGTTNPGGFTSMSALDESRTLQETDVIDTASMDNYVRAFPGFTNVDFPPELRLLTGYSETSSGTGSYNETGSYTITGNGSGGVSLHGTAEGSASALSDLGFDVFQPWGVNIPCMNYLFLVPSGTSRADIVTKLKGGNFTDDNGLQDWPRFIPGPLTFVCQGQRASGTLTLSSHSSDTMKLDYLGQQAGNVGSVRVTGSGKSYVVGGVVKIIRVPPTIHGAKTVKKSTGADWVNITQAYSAAGSISDGINPKSDSLAGSVVCSISPTSVVATVGDTVIPVSGNRVCRLVCEPYKDVYIKCHAEVIDMGVLQ